MDIFEQIDAKEMRRQEDQKKINKTRTGLSMQATVLNALSAKLPTNNPGPIIQG